MPSIFFNNIYYIKYKMDFNTSHPSFINFLDNVTNTIQSHITVDNYFNLMQDKKLGVQYIAFKLVRTSLKIKGKLTDEKIKSFIIILWKRNEENENYELAAILNDIIINYDAIKDKTKTTKQVTKIKEKKS